MNITVDTAPAEDRGGSSGPLKVVKQLLLLEVQGLPEISISVSTVGRCKGFLAL